MKRLDEWRNCKKFETEIYVDENLNLFDGYTAYLMYRMLGIFDIPVVIGLKMKGASNGNCSYFDGLWCFLDYVKFH